MTEILISLDITRRDEIRRVVDATHDLRYTRGYKVGALCSLALGLGAVVALIRKYTSKQIVYDHQKAGNDIPDITRKLVSLAATCGTNAFILFPFAGLETMRAGIDEGRDKGLTMIVGAYMTHPSFTRDQGGFMRKTEIGRIFDAAMNLGIKDFVLPGNQPQIAAKYAKGISEKTKSPIFWAPGFGRQGGTIREFSERLDGKGHLIPILGSSVYEAKDPAKELERLCSV